MDFECNLLIPDEFFVWVSERSTLGLCICQTFNWANSFVSASQRERESIGYVGSWEERATFGGVPTAAIMTVAKTIING